MPLAPPAPPVSPPPVVGSVTLMLAPGAAGALWRTKPGHTNRPMIMSAATIISAAAQPAPESSRVAGVLMTVAIYGVV